MPETLGKIEKPSTELYKSRRKLYFVPIIFMPKKPEPEFQKIVEKYWDEAYKQIRNLEQKLGKVKKIYHELIPVGDGEGKKVIEEINPIGYKTVVEAILKENDAKLVPVEDKELLAEFMDWSGCLSIELRSQKVFNTVYNAYVEAQKNRNEYIARQIDETLKNDEIALLLMREKHQVQFPSSIEVFYIAPPDLEDVRHWLRDKEMAEG
jgi:coenzyme F420-reducing hydrogenase alpha subunit